MAQPPQHLIQLLEQSQQQLTATIGVQPLNRQETSGGIAEAALDGTIQPLTDGVPYSHRIALTQGDRG